MNAFRHVLDVYANARDLQGNPEFVGYGNPFSDVLIIGQENTMQGVDWEKFARDNCQQWIQTIKENLRAHELCEVEGAQPSDYKFPEFFNPRNPFFPKKVDFQESHTWYNYQKIMDVVCPHSGNLYNFFDHCFITEMSNICSAHNPQSKDVEHSIAHRFDLMKETKDFWSHFKVVILACGHYADAIKDKEKFPTLYEDMFGSAEACFTKQLSQVSNEEIERIKSVIADKLNLNV
ncbi:MAG: hypothetical protein J6Y55_07950 [Bacteroidales bacterium]|nr:hypothetical protein [Bacteroidales bacterium]